MKVDWGQLSQLTKTVRTPTSRVIIAMRRNKPELRTRVGNRFTLPTSLYLHTTTIALQSSPYNDVLQPESGQFVPSQPCSQKHEEDRMVSRPKECRGGTKG